MRSEKQREASRRNGALSRGPVTPKGRANSARGALVPGLYARDVVLSGENREHYKAILDAFVQDWQPTTDTQLLLVADAASCYWRLLRAESHETVLTEVRSEAERDETERIVPGGGPRARFAFGFQRISDQSSVLSQDQPVVHPPLPANGALNSPPPGDENGPESDGIWEQSDSAGGDRS